VRFAKAIVHMKDQLEQELGKCKILDIENKINADNPMLLFHIQDEDGDKHDLVIKLIQRPDK
jgi:hypothetical protein